MMRTCSAQNLLKDGNHFCWAVLPHHFLYSSINTPVPRMLLMPISTTSMSEIGAPGYCAKISLFVSYAIRVSNPSAGFQCFVISSLLDDRSTSLRSAYLSRNHWKASWNVCLQFPVCINLYSLVKAVWRSDKNQPMRLEFIMAASLDYFFWQQ